MSQVNPDPTPTPWFPLKQWAASKNFTIQHAYALIKRGKLNVVKSGARTYVTSTEDGRFDEACAAAAQIVEPEQLEKARAERESM